jgi:OFA family oxalate/formate antiporter-like MFS transporter
VLSKIWRPDTPFAPRNAPFFYGWAIVFGATLGTIFSIPGQTMGFSVFTEIMMKELGLSRVELSSAYFVGTLASGLTLPFAGRLYDHWGGRRMVVASALVTGLILFYFAGSARASRSISELLPNVSQVVISFTVIAFGFFVVRFSAQGVLTMSCRNMMGKWFDRKRGIAIGISAIFTSFGFSFAPKGLDMMIEKFGYEGCWNILGFLSIFGMAVIGWLVFRDNPEECGLKMDGAVDEEDHEPAPSQAGVAQFETATRATLPPQNPDTLIKREFTRQEAIRTGAFWVFALSLSWFGLYFTAFTFHIVSIAAELGRTKDFVLTLFIPISLISVVSGLAFGFAGPHIRLKSLLVVMNVAAVLGALGMVFLDRSWGVVAFVIGNGITGGAFSNLLGVAFPRFFGRKHLGAISGVNMSAMVIASGLGPVVFAVSQQLLGSYVHALTVSIAVPATFSVLGWIYGDNPQRKLPD